MTTTTSDTIFQLTDLANRRVEVVEAARQGGARVRDKDGTSLLMLRESHVRVLEGLSEWTRAYLQLERLLRREGEPSVSELGDLAWLRVFSESDQALFLDDLHDALVSAAADGDLRPVEHCVGDWRVTARQLDDPLRRSVLLNTELDPDDLVDAARP